MDLSIAESQRGDVTIVTLIGHLTMGHQADELDKQLQKLVVEKKTRILLNIDEVTYIDSYGVGGLVAFLSAVKKNGGSLKFAKPTEFVRAVLRTTRLDRMFALYDSEEEALASFALPDQADSDEKGAER